MKLNIAPTRETLFYTQIREGSVHWILQARILGWAVISFSSPWGCKESDVTEETSQARKRRLFTVGTSQHFQVYHLLPTLKLEPPPTTAMDR